jgi:hypothetical protein
MNFEVGKQYKNKDGDIILMTKKQDGIASALIFTGDNTTCAEDVVDKIKTHSYIWDELPEYPSKYAASTPLGDFSHYKKGRE